jgi:hypothetical protein
LASEKTPAVAADRPNEGAGVGEELEQRPSSSGVGEEAGELATFEDCDVLGCLARLFARFELADPVGGEPATAHTEAADPSEVIRTMRAVVGASARAFAG